MIRVQFKGDFNFRQGLLVFFQLIKGKGEVRMRFFKAGGHLDGLFILLSGLGIFFS